MQLKLAALYRGLDLPVLADPADPARVAIDRTPVTVSVGAARLPG